eukprot:g1448.t1
MSDPTRTESNGVGTETEHQPSNSEFLPSQTEAFQARGEQEQQPQQELEQDQQQQQQHSNSVISNSQLAGDTSTSQQGSQPQVQSLSQHQRYQPQQGHITSISSNLPQSSIPHYSGSGNVPHSSHLPSSHLPSSSHVPLVSNIRSPTRTVPRADLGRLRFGASSLATPLGIDVQSSIGSRIGSRIGGSRIGGEGYHTSSILSSVPRSTRGGGAAGSLVGASSIPTTTYADPNVSSSRRVSGNTNTTVSTTNDNTTTALLPSNRTNVQTSLSQNAMSNSNIPGTAPPGSGAPPGTAPSSILHSSYSSAYTHGSRLAPDSQIPVPNSIVHQSSSLSDQLGTNLRTTRGSVVPRTGLVPGTSYRVPGSGIRSRLGGSSQQSLISNAATNAANRYSQMGLGGMTFVTQQRRQQTTTALPVADPTNLDTNTNDLSVNNNNDSSVINGTAQMSSNDQNNSGSTTVLNSQNGNAMMTRAGNGQQGTGTNSYNNNNINGPNDNTIGGRQNNNGNSGRQSDGHNASNGGGASGGSGPPGGPPGGGPPGDGNPGGGDPPGGDSGGGNNNPGGRSGNNGNGSGRGPNNPPNAPTASQTTGTYVWGTDIEVDETLEKFMDFIAEFRLDDEEDQQQQQGEDETDSPAYYIKRLREMQESQSTSLHIDCAHLRAFPETRELYNQLVKYPQEIIPLMDWAVFQIYKELFGEEDPLVQSTKRIQVRTFNLSSQESMRNLNPSHVNQLVAVRGMITRCSKIIPDLKTGFFKCTLCHHTVEVGIDRGLIAEPQRCPACDSKNSMQIQHNRCFFLDKQLIKLQEAPEAIPEVDVARAGDRCEITGVFRALQERTNAKRRACNALFKTFLDVIHFRKTETTGNAANERESQRKKESNANDGEANEQDNNLGIQSEIAGGGVLSAAALGRMEARCEAMK